MNEPYALEHNAYVDKYGHETPWVRPKNSVPPPGDGAPPPDGDTPGGGDGPPPGPAGG